MKGLLFLFSGLFTCGMFLILADILRLPYMRTAKAMLNTGRREKKVAKAMEAYMLSAAVKIAGHVRMDEYKRKRMQNILDAAGMGLTPEVYQTYAFVKAGAVLMLVVPCLFFFPLLAPLVLILSIMVYFKESRRADEKLAAKRESIENDLPRFAATIEQELKNSRDVLSIIESFRKNAGAAFAGELDIVAADMRSSSYEAALTRFEARLNSPMLSDVVRGLIGVLRGDDSAVYFQMLSRDFRQLELQKLKKEAQKIPPKIRVFSFIMLMCFMFTYLAIIVLEILNSLGGMF